MTGTPAPIPRVAVDAMGGDHGPAVVVEGALAACREFDLRALLVGPRALVESELARVAGAAAALGWSTRPRWWGWPRR